MHDVTGLKCWDLAKRVQKPVWCMLLV